MEDGKTADGNNDHSALENHKRDLVIRQLAMEPPAELRTPKAAPNKNRQRGQPQREHKRLELETRPQASEPGLEHTIRRLPHPPCEFSAQSGKEREREDLKTHTRHHNMDAILIRGVGSGAARDSATRGLQEQGNKIAPDKRQRVRPRLEPRQRLREHDDNPRKTQIDTRAQERGADRQCDEVHEERGSVKGFECIWMRPT